MLKDFAKSLFLVFRVTPRLCLARIVLEVCAALTLPLSLILVQKVVDGIISFVKNNSEIHSLVFHVILLCVVLIMIAVLNYAINRINNSLSKKLNAEISQRILNKFRKIKYEYFENPSFLDTLQRMREDPDKEIVFVFKTSIDLVSNIIRILSLAFLFATANYWLALFYLILITFIVFLDFKAMNRMNTMFNSQSESERRMNDLSSLLSSKNSLFELRIMQGVKLIADKLHNTTEDVRKERVSTTLKSQLYSSISRILIFAWFIGTLAYHIGSLREGNITVGLFTTLASSLTLALSLSESLSYSFSSLVQDGLIIKHYQIFMNIPEEDMQTTNNPITRQSDDFVVFDNVSFKYPQTENRVLKNISFKIGSKEKIALVGANGSGKSTIIKLLLRLYSPDSGKIYVNGVDLEKISRKGIHEFFSVVFQNYANYQLSVRENVALSRIEGINDDHEIKRVLNLIGLDNLSENPDRQLGKLENDGVGLSGGQWQRLAIARTLFDKSDFVLFDEPTAALDPMVESELYDSLKNLLENRGCILISHRLGSVKTAEKIMVLNNGEIVETGTHEQLMESQGLYGEMYKSQSSWYTKI